MNQKLLNIAHCYAARRLCTALCICTEPGHGGSGRLDALLLGGFSRRWYRELKRVQGGDAYAICDYAHAYDNSSEV